MDDLQAYGRGSSRATLALIDAALHTFEHVTPDAPDAATVDKVVTGDADRFSSADAEDLVLAMFERELSRGTLAPCRSDPQRVLFMTCLLNNRLPLAREVAARFACDRVKGIVEALATTEQGSSAGPHGFTAVEVAERVRDPDLCADLRARFAAHIAMCLKLPVRWGHRVTLKRAESGVGWSRADENNKAFREDALNIAQERGFQDSIVAAGRSMRLGSVFAVYDHGAALSVAHMVQQRDIDEMLAATCDTAGMVVLMSALAAQLAKCTMRVRASAGTRYSMRIYARGGWRSVSSERDAAHSLVIAAMSDLDKLRTSFPKLGEKFPASFTRQMNTSVPAVTSVVEDAIRNGGFPDSLVPLDPMQPMSRPVAVRTIPMTIPPTPWRTHTWEVAHASPSPPCALKSVPTSPAEAAVAQVHIHDAPALNVMATHLSDAGLRGVHSSQREGAACYILHGGEWVFPSDQRLGSVYIEEAVAFLGYLGFGLHAYRCIAIDNCDQARDTVAVCNTIKSGVHGDHVVADMVRMTPGDTALLDGPMRLSPAARPPRRLRVPPPFRPAYLDGAALAAVEPAIDHSQALPRYGVPGCPIRVAKHEWPRGAGDVIVYTLGSGDTEVRAALPLTAWDDADAQLRSAIRAYWRNVPVEPVEVDRSTMRLAAGDWSGRVCPHDHAKRTVQPATYVLFEGRSPHRVAPQQYTLSNRALLSMWDGHACIACDGHNAVTYVLENCCPNSRYRLAVVAGLRLRPFLPRSIARLLCDLWGASGVTCPHTDPEDEDDADEQRGECTDIAPEQMPAWLDSEQERVCAVISS